MSGLNKAGGISAILDPEFTVVSAAATLTPAQNCVDCASSSAAYTITLPSHSNCVGRDFYFRATKITGAYVISIKTAAGTTVATLFVTGQTCVLRATPTGWVSYGSHYPLGSGIQAAVTTLVASDVAATPLSVKNDSGKRRIIVGFFVDLTTVATGACTLDFGVAATAVTADTLIDGMNAHTATGVFDNITNKGSNGKTCIAWPDGYFVTGSMASGAAAGLAGTATILFVEVE